MKQGCELVSVFDNEMCLHRERECVYDQEHPAQGDVFPSGHLEIEASASVAVMCDLMSSCSIRARLR